MIIGFAMTDMVLADTTLATFDDFYSDALYNSWASQTAVIESGTTNYVITATGYGSNYKYNPVDGTGNATIELTVTLGGPPEADGKLGPIVSLVDADGTFANYAWYGQTLGQHVLTMPLSAPSWITAPGTTPGLDLATLTHMHMQVDPSSFTSGAYTISWENLRLVSAPPLIELSSVALNPTTREFSLTWSSETGKIYQVLHCGTVNGSYGPLATDIASGGTTTSTTVTVPVGDAGFLRVREQP